MHFQKLQTSITSYISFSSTWMDCFLNGFLNYCLRRTCWQTSTETVLLTVAKTNLPLSAAFDTAKHQLLFFSQMDLGISACAPMVHLQPVRPHLWDIMEGVSPYWWNDLHSDPPCLPA